jgi:hypothetical protein
MADVSRVTGPLGPFSAGFVDDLSRQGFQVRDGGQARGAGGGVERLAGGRGVAVTGCRQRWPSTTPWRRAGGHSNRLTIKALDPLLGYLNRLGVAPPASAPVCAGPVEVLLSRFRRYLEQERGLVPAAAGGYVQKVRPFVARFDGPDGLEFWRVDAAEVRAFVVEVCPRLGLRAAQLTVVALRSLLRFLHLDGALERSLASAVPSVFGPAVVGAAQAP